MSGRPSSSTAEEVQTMARVSVKDRLGPLPPQSSSKRRDRSVDRNHRRGRKFSESVQGPETNFSGGAKPAGGRVPVHERLGPLPPQSLKPKNDLFHKRNRQQVWRHQGNFKTAQQPPSKKVEAEEGIPELANTADVENVLKFVKPSVPAQIPVVQPFNAEQHRQAWTWVRPTTNSTAMEVDESTWWRLTTAMDLAF